MLALQSAPGSREMPPRSLARTIVVQAVGGAVAAGLLLFLPAGTLAWPQGWAFLVLFWVGSEAQGVWMLRNDPALLAARLQSPLSPDQAPRDRAVMALILISFIAWIVFMALDARRFGWSHTPPWAQALGAALLVAAFWGWFLVLRANSFAATTIRLQAERRQSVISTGPYAVVRHPMYAFTLLFMVGAPLLLGSLWGLAGLLVFIPLLAARTLGEEAMLRRGLPGYADYARRVRFRLAPGIW
jgi:protein-S-isoprenylcysteine O-methyltransferase Ste14